MNDARPTREERLRELVERLRGAMTEADECVEAVESLRSHVAAARLGRVETYLFDGILHDAQELRARLTTFAEAVGARTREA